MIKIYCNANVYISLAKNEYPEGLSVKLKQYKESGKIQVYSIPTNHYEIIQGVNSEAHFQEAKQAFSKMMFLTEGKMLPDHKIHVQRAVCRHLGLNEPIWNDDFLNSSKNLFKQPSFKQANEKLTLLKKYFRHVQVNWVADTERVAAELSRIHKEKQITVDEFLGEVSEEVLWPAMQQRFEIERYVKGMRLSEIRSKIPALWFWYSISIGYYRKLGEDGRKPVPSDLVDLEQVIYLDEMNWFIVEDAKFAKVLKRALSKELADLCISFGDFITMLEINLPI